MDTTRLEATAGMVLVLAGLTMATASLTSAGEAQSWDVADAFAADSVRGIRRVGMFLAALGLASLVAAAPVLMAVTSGTKGFGWTVFGWGCFALGATLFSLVLGVTSIVMPALGELAEAGTVSPQAIADRLTRQAPIMAAFLGGNLTFLSWIPIGLGLGRSGVLPSWLGWFVAAAAVATWLGFLHVPVFQRLAGPLWPLAVALVGVFVVRLASGAA